METTVFATIFICIIISQCDFYITCFLFNLVSTTKLNTQSWIVVVFCPCRRFLWFYRFTGWSTKPCWKENIKIIVLKWSLSTNFQSSSTSSQDDEKSTLEEVSEGAIPIDQPTPGPSTPGSQGPELPFQSHSQSQGHGLNKSSSSPELQTLPEAFAKANLECESVQGDAPRPRAPSDGKPPAQQPQFEKDKVKGSTGVDVNGLGRQNQAGDGSGPTPQSGGLRLSFPAAPTQSGPISPGGGHRPRGHTISVSAPSRRERRTERDSYHNRPGPSNAEKTSGLSPRYCPVHTGRCCTFSLQFVAD